MGACKKQCILAAFSSNFAANMNFKLSKVVVAIYLRRGKKVLNICIANYILFPAMTEF